jgi:undecaprenyl-diphosphatase
MGVVLGIADRIGKSDRTIRQLTLNHAVLYGLAQAMALIPGVSRSGATISMGRLLGYDREAATRYAFLLAIPAVIGAGIFELKDVLACGGGSVAEECVNTYSPMATFAATVVAFVVGYAAIAWLLRYVSTRSYLPFVVYRIALGGFTLLMLSLGVIAA